MALTIDIHNLEGKVTGKMELPAELFDAAVNPDILAQALRVHQANTRQGTSRVKTRSEVNRTGHKVWKQKGTGRARHGDKGAPIFVGGGIAHGPSGNQSYDLKMNKRVRQMALKGALTEALKSGSILVVEGLDSLDRSTKALASTLKALNTDTTRTLLMIESPMSNVVSAGKNIKNVTVTQANRTNIFEVLAAQKIIVHKPAIAALTKTYGQAQKKAA